MIRRALAYPAAALALVAWAILLLASFVVFLLMEETR